MTVEDIKEEVSLPEPPPASDLFTLEGQQRHLVYLAEYLLARFRTGKAGGREVETYIRLIDMMRQLRLNNDVKGEIRIIEGEDI